MIMRCLFLAAVLLAAVWSCGRSSAAVRSEIIAEPTARRYGLTRPWFTQIQLDRGRARVAHVVLHEGILYVQTDRATVHALDAETGETLWVKLIGRPNHPSMTPGVSHDLLAIINGSRLYVCNRFNGNLLFETRIDGAPGAGAAVSEKRAYVPTVNGLVIAYRLEPLTDPSEELHIDRENLSPEEIAAAEARRRENIRIRQEFIPPLSCQSLGRSLVQPLITRQTAGEEFVAWPTDRGYLNIGRIDRRREDIFAVKYRLQTGGEIAARPTYLPPDPKIAADTGVIYGASQDGFVHAIREKNGESLWRFSTGEPITEPAVVIAQNVYVATQFGGMYCLNAKTGSEQWWAPRVEQFIAASKERVYVADKLGRILILHAGSGARLDTFPLRGLPIKLINGQTDRLYLANRTGLIQCLREVELTEPIRHKRTPPKAAEAEKVEPEEAEPEEAEEAPQDEPAAEEEDIFGDDDEPVAVF